MANKMRMASIPARVQEETSSCHYDCHADELIFPQSKSPRKGRPGTAAMVFVALLVYCATSTYLSRSGMFLCGGFNDGGSESTFLEELDGVHNDTSTDTEDSIHTESESKNSTQNVHVNVNVNVNATVESASSSKRQPQRLLELPYAKQKGSWIGYQWVPPNGWRFFSAKEMRTFYKNKSVMFIGDSLAELAAATLHGILEQVGNASDANANVNVPVAALNNITEFKRRTIPGGADGDYYVHVLKKEQFSELQSFLEDELSGKSKMTENIGTIIIAMGNNLPDSTDESSTDTRDAIFAKLTEIVNMLGTLQSKKKTIIWRTSGDKKATGVDVNMHVVDQIDSIATRLLQEKNTKSNLTSLNWADAVYSRSFGKRRIKGDGEHGGLAARLALMQMMTNHLASRQGLEF